MNLTIINQLLAIGLSKNQARLYAATLELGEVQIGAIERQTGLHKQLIYDAAEGLQREGLLAVSVVRGRKRFRAADPSLLEHRIEDRLIAVRGLLPALYKLASEQRVDDLVRTFEGELAIRQFYQQSIRLQPEKAPIMVIGVGGQNFFQIWDYESIAFRRFEEVRVRRSILLRMLFLVQDEQIIPSVEGINGRELVETKFFKELPQAPIDMVVWATHVSLLLYGNKHHVIDIPGEQAVQGFRSYFEAMWRHGT